MNENFEPTGDSLSVRTLVAKSSITTTELKNFMDWTTRLDIEINDDLMKHPDFLPYALTHTCFKTFLIDYGYIQLVFPTWKPFAVGDTFRMKGAHVIYMYVRTEAYRRAIICLTGVDRGNRLTDPIAVHTNNEVSKEGFEQILGDKRLDEVVPVNVTSITEDKNEPTRTNYPTEQCGLGTGHAGTIVSGAQNIGGTEYPPPGK